MSPRTLIHLLPPIGALMLLLVVWQTIHVALDISPLILPSPVAVADQLISRADYLGYHALKTLAESLLGFLLGALLAVSLSIPSVLYPQVHAAVYPYAIGLKSIPLVALAPLVVVWCGTGILSKIVLAAIISFFPILVGAIDGMRSVSAASLDMFRAYGASASQIMLHLRIPSAIPQLLAGMKVASTFAVVGAVVAEFTGSQAGIGYVVKSSSYYLETDLTFAAILVAGATGLVFFLAIVLLGRRLLRWQTVDSRDDGRYGA